MKRIFRVFIAEVRANVWCLFHLGQCILKTTTKESGYWAKTERLEVGTGSILKGTWKTVRVFYEKLEGSV
jgi:hypothetical protein